MEVGTGWAGAELETQCPSVSLGLGLGSRAKGRMERSQVVLIGVTKAHKCPQEAEAAPSGARLQPEAYPGAEPCQELSGRAQRPAPLSLWQGPPAWAGVSVSPVPDRKQPFCAGESKKSPCLALQLGACPRLQD